MINATLKQFILILPEISLLLLALFSQLAGLFCRSKIKLIINLTVLLSVILFFFTFSHFFLINSNYEWIKTAEIMRDNFSIILQLDSVISIAKTFVLLFSIITLVIYKDYCQIINEELKIEFITLILLSTFGSFVAISSYNFLLLFCSIELQALISYVLAGFSLHNLKSSEGALKYFILGALISCLSLLGMSFIYGFGGSIDYQDIFQKMRGVPQPNIGLIVGLVLFLTSLFFKLSVVPLHIWTPDVYEGSFIPSVAYFSASTKIANISVLLNILYMVIGGYKQISSDLVRIVAILSMLTGAIGAIKQTSLKRLMGYSTILNIGYVLIGVSIYYEDNMGNIAALLYMIIYAASIIGFFTCLIILLGKKSEIATFEYLEGIGATKKALAAGIAIIMFSLIGIPPLAGFFGKYFLFYQAIVHREFTLAIIGIGSSVISAYYYLKIVRSMYFVEASKNYFPDAINTYLGLKIIRCFIVGFLLFFSLLLILLI